MKTNQSIGAMIALVMLSGTLWFVWDSFVRTTAAPSDSSDAASDATSDSTINAVTLSDAKLAAAGIRIELVRVGNLERTRVLPARFQYDDNRHVSLRTPTDGVVESVMVKPGDAVSKGHPVAIIRSPAIGVARNEILNLNAQLELATNAYTWESGIHEGVKEMVGRFRRGESVDEIKREMKGKTLGEFGGSLLTAYSQSKLASSNSRSIGSIGASGAVSGRVVRERESQRQQADAALEALIQQSLFHTRQAMAKANAKVEEAERSVRIAKQTLSTLVGTTPTSSDGLDVSPNDRDVSRLTFKSPIDGTIEKRNFSATERVNATDELFVIADTSQLWVEADVRGRDWDSIDLMPGDRVMVATPSVDAPPQPAEVYFVGRQVDSASGAIPLVATIDNSAGSFRPGLFARMIVPVDQLENRIIVAESAIVDLEGQDSVFIQGEQGFVPIAVEVGESSDGLVEVRRGLSEGQAVVTAGAFTLKSELLLEGEE